MTGELPRRSFLRRAVVGAGLTAATMAGGAGVASAGENGAEGRNASTALPFHGPNQAAIAALPAGQSIVASFDVIAENRAELTDLLRSITERARVLSDGGTPSPVGITAPPPDSGVLGPELPAGGPSVVVGVGASLFDDRYGLAGVRPAGLTPMRTFPNDALDPAQCHGDLSLTLSAASTDTVVHALRDICRATRGGMQLRWKLNGFSSPPRPTGTPRNLMGFKDGISNPNPDDHAEMQRLVWLGGAPGEPAWATGGSYQVIRLIRMRVEFWDRVSLSEQENMFGRRRDTGAPLDGTAETDVPQYADDPAGAVIPLTSHIRRANPRTADSDSSRILRRAVNYDRGIDSNGQLDMGLIFVSYQQDLQRQFEAIQTRLADEPLVDYISPFGGGYFLALPGVADQADHYGRAMLA